MGIQTPRPYRVLVNGMIHSATTTDGLIWKCKNFKGEVTEHLIEELENAEIFNREKYKQFDLWQRQG